MGKPPGRQQDGLETSVAGVGGEDEGRPWAAKEPPEPVGTTVGFRQRPVGTLALRKEHRLLPGGLGGEEGSQEASWGLSESEGSGGGLAVTGDTCFYVPVPRKGLGGWGGIAGGLRAGAPFPQGSGREESKASESSFSQVAEVVALGRGEGCAGALKRLTGEGGAGHWAASKDISILFPDVMLQQTHKYSGEGGGRKDGYKLEAQAGKEGSGGGGGGGRVGSREPLPLSARSPVSPAPSRLRPGH